MERFGNPHDVRRDGARHEDCEVVHQIDLAARSERIESMPNRTARPILGGECSASGEVAGQDAANAGVVGGVELAHEALFDGHLEAGRAHVAC